MLAFAVVGGGPTGVEVAAELRDMLTDATRRMPHIKVPRGRGGEAGGGRDGVGQAAVTGLARTGCLRYGRGLAPSLLPERACLPTDWAAPAGL
jgi:hypothetical protein